MKNGHFVFEPSSGAYM